MACEKADFALALRSGCWTDIGEREHMEDFHVIIENMEPSECLGAFYGVFDGHGGKGAAQFTQKHLLNFILEDEAFPSCMEDAMKHAFIRTDDAFREACLLDETISSGTTALAVIVRENKLIVANAGDCRAVLSRRGKAMEMSKDHKPILEETRIKASRGYVDDGYINGELGISRAIGNWHRKGLREIDGYAGPLISEPEVQVEELTKEDEFLIIACDGLWDVFTSQNAVDVARKELQTHNDPKLCSKKLVAEALSRDNRGNITVVTVCFRTDAPPCIGVGSDIRSRKRFFSTEVLQSLQGILDGSC